MCTSCEAMNLQRADCVFDVMEEFTATTNADLPTGTAGEMADYLIDGYWESQGAARRAFGSHTSTNVTTISVNLHGLSEESQALARRALEAWSNVAAIEFEEDDAGSQSDITFTEDQAGAYCSMSYSGRLVKSAVVNISSKWVSRYGDQMDDYVQQTYIHEIGHALGLGHLGSYNSSAKTSELVFSNDSYQMSVMSYFSQVRNESVDADYAIAVTPMMADIVAIQQMYGVSDATAGATRYGVGNSLDTAFGMMLEDLASGETSDLFSGDAVAFTLMDHSGRDLLDLSGLHSDNVIDLNPGTFSDIGGVKGAMGIARGTIIENLITGSGDDVITGNREGNIIRSGDGQDEVNGAKGRDKLFGEGGDDVLSGSGGKDRLFGGDGDDWLYGGNHNDTLYGETGMDVLTGNGGADWLFGGEGADLIIGGAGGDKLDGGAQSDRLYGHTGNDQLSGGDGDDELDGGKGKDLLSGGAGDDFLRGNIGRDTFLFNVHDGNDVIYDFSAEEYDRLLLDRDLWDDQVSRKAGIKQFVDLSEDGDGLVISGIHGESILLEGVFELEEIYGRITLI